MAGIDPHSSRKSKLRGTSYRTAKNARCPGSFGKVCKERKKPLRSSRHFDFTQCKPLRLEYFDRDANRVGEVLGRLRAQRVGKFINTLARLHPGMQTLIDAV